MLKYLFFGCLWLYSNQTYLKAQVGIDTLVQQQAQQVAQLPDKLIGKLDEKYGKMDSKMEQSTTKMLKRMQQQEAKLKSKLAKLDSNKAKQLFANSSKYYEGLQAKIKDKTGKVQQLNQYIPKLDSLSTATKFLEGTGSKLNGLIPTAKLDQLKQLNGKLSNVQSSIQSAGEIRKLLSERKQQLQEALKQYHFGKQFKNMNKEIFYYQEQLKAYKNLLQDKQKLEEKALQLVRELPAFKTFMQQNSWLAKLFPMPSNYGTAAALEGLQTRASIQNELTQRLAGVGGANPQQYLNGQVQVAKKELDALKNKVNQAGGEDADMEIPNFKPNQQKTKSFWQRLEYGFNIQSQKSNQLLPSTSDLAATLGYKLSDKSTIGIGSSYKIGWGNGFRDIRLSSQGIGLRSFIDVRLKGSIWITGGYEQNYLPALGEQLEGLGVPDLTNPSWQASGLVGLSKKYTIGKKTHNLQLLWDFLSYRQIPRTEPLKFRVGFKL